jgi:hypothetical protein
VPPIFTREDQPALLANHRLARALRLRGCHPLRQIVPDHFGLGTSAISLWPSHHISPNSSLRDSVWPDPFSLAVTQGITFCFLFLPVLRCFNSERSHSSYDTGAMRGISPHEEVPFGHPRIKGFMRLPAAFRCLSRPSSASKPSHPPTTVSAQLQTYNNLAGAIFPNCVAYAT